VEALNAVGYHNVQDKKSYYEEKAEAIANGDNVTTHLECAYDCAEKGRKKVIADTLALDPGGRGMVGFKKTTDYEWQLKQYQKLKGTQADFDAALAESIVSGSIDGVKVTGLNSKGVYWEKDDISITLPGGSTYDLGFRHYEDGGVNSTTKDALNKIIGRDPEDGWLAMLNKVPYIYIGGNRNNWYSLNYAN
jgi:hypothetical protein